MSFWQEASPIVKGAIVVGGLGIAYFLVAMVAGLPPYGETPEVTQERGVQVAPQ
jgi:hypothetical protein